MRTVVRSRMRRGIAAAVAATAAVTVLCGAAQPAVAAEAPTAPAAPTQVEPAPAGDAFYTPPNPIPESKPGDIIRSRKTAANRWLVMYRSTDALGEPNVVTGTILTPPNVTDLTKVPVVAFGPGTQGPAFRCVASKALQTGLLYEGGVVNDSLNAGYAVAVTDYEGYSQNTTPTYIVGKPMGAAMLDGARAATRLTEAGLGESGHKVAIQGYSQGGGASMWAAEMASTYAPELDIVGSIAGGVPADLDATQKVLNGGLGFGFLAFAAVGLDLAYPELKLDSYLNDTGRTMLEQARKGDCLGELVIKYPFKKISDFTTSNPLDTPQWQARLAENKLGKNPPKFPVFQYHGLLDEIIPFGQADTLNKTYCAAGVKQTFKTYPIAEHVIGIFAGQGDSKVFLADRFAGKPATSTC